VGLCIIHCSLLCEVFSSRTHQVHYYYYYYYTRNFVQLVPTTCSMFDQFSHHLS
jgi:hypothetical protein